MTPAMLPWSVQMYGYRPRWPKRRVQVPRRRVVQARGRFEPE